MKKIIFISLAVLFMHYNASAMQALRMVGKQLRNSNCNLRTISIALSHNKTGCHEVLCCECCKKLRLEAAELQKEADDLVKDIEKTKVSLQARGTPHRQLTVDDSWDTLMAITSVDVLIISRLGVRQGIHQRNEFVRENCCLM